MLTYMQTRIIDLLGLTLSTLLTRMIKQPGWLPTGYTPLTAHQIRRLTRTDLRTGIHRHLLTIPLQQHLQRLSQIHIASHLIIPQRQRMVLTALRPRIVALLFVTDHTFELLLVVEFGFCAFRAAFVLDVEEVVGWVAFYAGQAVEVGFRGGAFRETWVVGDVGEGEDVGGANHGLVVL